ncbi:EAL domain-containing protein [Vibrio sp. NH-UV-68]|uniref:putative bifunctional diguanylate cyclase/phosphodiesterase n=1 Tax=unclassified Vibrio TaxID=2614977 RepID=UPI0036F28EC7
MKKSKDSNLLDAVENTTAVGTWSLDFHSQTLHWSANTKRIHDVPSSYEPQLESAIDFYPVEFRAELHSQLHSAVHNQTPLVFTTRIVSATGREKWVKVFGQSEPHQGVLYGAIQDITEEIALSKRLTELLANRDSALNNVIEAIVHYHCDGHIVSVNNVASNLFLYTEPQLLDLNIAALLEQNHIANLSCCKGNEQQQEILARKSDGSTFPATLITSAIDNSDVCMAIFRDLSGEFETLERIERLTFFDELSGLPNRHYLMAELENKIANVRNLIAININNFSKINLACGHDEGDRVLLEVARQLNQRAGKHALVVRDLADRFFVLQSSVDSAHDQDGRLLASRLLEIQDSPLAGGKLHYLSLSLGIASIKPKERASDAIARAESALLTSRSSPTEPLHIYEASDTDTLKKQYSIEQALRHAIESNRITFYLQPKVNHHMQVTSAELLIRWVDADGHSPFNPDDFIPVAEESGLMMLLGRKAITYAARCLSDMQLSHPTLTLSVNVSPSQFMSHQFVGQLQEIFNRYDVSLNKLMIEVTENLLLHDETEVTKTIARLKSLGVKISLDDFGTGYSNLKRILDLNIDDIKIDKSLMIGLENSEKSKALIDSIVLMANSLSLPLTAEGVETKEVVEYCQEAGIQQMQGYYFAKPMPFQRFMMWLRKIH